MRKSNHLIKEKSPYLLQHAYNPVDWHPWGPEAFAKARRENKPILLSIGYSTCHWCHVMERESFSDEGIAALMNKNFVCVKLDREEHPDVDRIYMTAVQVLTGQGGWPLNVFLTPELKPFFGGTYFPPAPRWGQPGFPQLVERVAELWATRRDAVLSDSQKLTSALQEVAARDPAGKSAPEPALLDSAYAGYRGSFDPEQGGFGGAPKFPMPVNQNFLLAYHARTGKKDALEMVLSTLRAMARGGIYDHVGGGFHRYSTDGQWRVPHFEKMLYDNAQLAVNFLEAFQASGDAELSGVARETLDYVLRDMTHPEGGFYSAEDADSLPPELAAKGVKDEGHSQKEEGAFYLWTAEELRRLLGGDAEAFSSRYGVEADGNAPADPHGEFAGKNILYLKAAPAMDQARRTLLKERAKRPRPHLDDKILTSWNGLMISALAKGAQALGEQRYREAAAKAARFLKDKLYDVKAGRLYHRWRDGERAVPGLSDDYAFLIGGLLDLYETDFDAGWLSWALELQEQADALFSGPDGGYFMTALGHDPHLLFRSQEEADNVEPASSSVGALNLLRLSHFTGRRDLAERAHKTLRLFAPRMKERPMSLPQMLAAAAFSLSKVRQVVIAADDPEAPDAQALLREVRRRHLPFKVVLSVGQDASRKTLEDWLPFLKTVKPIKGKAAAYVCVDYSCKLPVTDPAKLGEILD